MKIGNMKIGDTKTGGGKREGSRSPRTFLYAATTAVVAALFVGSEVGAITSAVLMPAENILVPAAHGLLAAGTGLAAGSAAGFFFGRGAFRAEIEMAHAGAAEPNAPSPSHPDHNAKGAA